MLPHNRRVSTAIFDEIMHGGTTYHSDHISLRIQQKTAQNRSRFSVAVSKKVEKQAVTRNLYKRRLYAVISHSISSIPHGFQGVFFIKKGFSDLSQNSVQRETILLLEKALKISLLS